ncbi:MAG: hypothetical protein Alis3KO_39790 [Aliiglaciecola sp.]
MKRKIHLAAALVATLCIATFFISTIAVELFGSKETITIVKALVVTPGLFILIPTMALVGGTGFSSSKNRRGQLIDKKKKRMPFIAAIGLLVLTPCAIFLSIWANTGSFDTRFYFVQGLELIAGATNLILMSLNLRDGLQITGKLRRNTSN